MRLLGVVEDLVYEDTFIRKFSSAKSNADAEVDNDDLFLKDNLTFMQYDKSHKLVNLEYAIKPVFMQPLAKDLTQDKKNFNF